MPGVTDVLKAYKKDHGEKAVFAGDECIDFERVPSGIFPFDLALGGGIPEGKVTMLVGPESSGKTTVALLFVAEYQRRNPGKTVIWIDAEHSYDKHWAMALGVDIEKLIVVQPDYGEQAVDFVEGLIGTDDMGALILDSVACLVPIAEIEGDASRAQVGGNSLLIGKMCRKILMALPSSNDTTSNFPTILFINQIRFKIGVRYGDPEDFPGGQTLKHTCNMIIRLYGKDEIIKAVNPKVPAVKTISMTLKKYKCPIVSRTAQFQMAILPFDGKKVGHVDYWNTVLAFAKDYGYIAKGPKNKGWTFNGAEYKTLDQVRDFLLANTDILDELKAKLISEAVENITDSCNA